MQPRLISATNEIQRIVFFYFLEILKRGLPRGLDISNSDVDPLYQPAACLMRWIWQPRMDVEFFVLAGTTVHGKKAD